jgi:hypothetical protein
MAVGGQAKNNTTNKFILFIRIDNSDTDGTEAGVVKNG